MWSRDQAEPIASEAERSADSTEFRQYIFSAYGGESGADGSTESLVGRARAPSEMPQVQLCLLSCCPCLLGNPCSASRRDEYSKAMRSFCFLISIVDIIMLIVALAIPPGPHIEPWFANPSLGPGDSTFVLLGAKITCKILVNGQFWRFLTPMYLHAGILHLLFNLYGQLRIGLYLENRWGWIKLTFVYFSSGIGGTLAGAVFQPSNISVAATACLMGLMGAYLAEIFCLWNRMEKTQRSMALFQIVAIIVISLLIGIAPLIDVSAHIGGLVCGLLVGISYSSSDLPYDWQRRVIPLLSVCVLIALFVAGVVEFYLFTTPPASSFCPL